MRKLFALVLISILLSYSCTKADKSDVGEYTLDVIVSTNQFPIIDADYNGEDHSRANIDYIVPMNGAMSVSIRDVISCEVDVTFKDFQIDKGARNIFGIISNSLPFKSYYRESTGENYNTRFSQDFFGENIVLYMYLQFKDFPFAKVDYTFDPESKTLNLIFLERSHEGWETYIDPEFVPSTAYFIPIAKSDITIDGKLVPYDELNIEVTGKLTLD